MIYKSLSGIVNAIKRDSKGWKSIWFRGEPDCESALLPGVYRNKSLPLQKMLERENRLLQRFRQKAPTFSHLTCPNRRDTDNWLFLARHVGLPTRLLDWTEGALIALYFALQEDRPVLWMINPLELNKKSVVKGKYESDAPNDFPLTWYDFPQPLKLSKKTGYIEHIKKEDFGRQNIGSINIKGAWQKDEVCVRLPVAIIPTNIHPRMSVQRSCFTVHGKLKDGIHVLVGEEWKFLKKYTISHQKKRKMLAELGLFGISQSTLFPDLDGLAIELKNSAMNL